MKAVFILLLSLVTFTKFVLAEDVLFKVNWVNSDEWKKRVKQFKLSHEDACKIAMKRYDSRRSEDKSSGSDFAGSKYIVGDYYWVGRSTKYLWALKYEGTGYYINGYTGEIQYRESEQSFSWGYSGHIKFSKITPLQ